MPGIPASLRSRNSLYIGSVSGAYAALRRCQFATRRSCRQQHHGYHVSHGPAGQGDVQAGGMAMTIASTEPSTLAPAFIAQAHSTAPC